MTSGKRTKSTRESTGSRSAQKKLSIELQRRRLRSAVGIACVAVAVAALAAGLALSGSSSTSPLPPPHLTLRPLSTLGPLVSAGSPGTSGAEGVPIPSAAALVGTASKAPGTPVDNIKCDSSEQVLFHIHAHLTVFVNGVAKQIPAGIGIPGAKAQSTAQGPFVESGTCFYWLHTHAADGIVHIESPVKRTYLLGNFFDIWGQPLGPDQVGPATGPVTAIYNGQVYVGNPRNIPLEAHAQIQLEVGKPLVAPVKITFPSGL